MMSGFWQRGTMFGALLALAIALVACGVPGAGGTNGGDTFSTETVAQQVQVAADPSGALRWDKATYEATAGDISFTVRNTSSMPHQFTIEGNGVNYRSPNIKANSAGTYTVLGLPAGEYKIVCDYPGHKAAGMVARLIVR